MLSIIVSSFQEEYFIQFSKNVKKTIGDDFEYEIIQQWNPGLIGICEAYNKGVEKAKYENILFVHEDVLFKTKNWGESLIDYLKIDNVGCVGVAGATYTPNVPFAWWDLHETNFRHVEQYNKDKFIHNYFLKEDKECKSLDGVFLACRKEIYEKYRFNEQIKKFHCYDIDFSNRISKNYINIVTSKILLAHFSEGSLNKEWIDDLIQYRRCFKAYNTLGINKKYEAFFFLRFIKYLEEFPFTKRQKCKLIWQYANPKYIGWNLSLKTLIKSV